MSRRVFGTLAAAALFALAPSAGLADDEKPVFKAGAAMANITPPLGEDIVGNFTRPKAAHVHDELHARCLVLDDGRTKLAIILSDNVGVPRAVHDAAKKIIAERNGIPATHVLSAATHTHSATSARQQLKDKLAPYQDFLARRIADGVQTAVNNLEPAKIGWGAVDVPQHVFNRRWLLKPGKTAKNPWGGDDLAQMNPGGNPNILEPAGPTDPEVSFLAVQSPDGKPIALLANYSLHYVGGVPGPHVSADYFAVFANKIADLLGADRRAFPPFVGIMSNGTSGDINNNNYGDPSRKSHPPYEKMNIVADDVAKAVAGAYRDVKFQDYVTLDAEYRELTLATRKPTQEQVDFAEKMLADSEAFEKLSVRDKSYVRRTISIQKSTDESVQAPLQAFRIGDLGVSAGPFEIFAETGLEIKERSPFKSTFTIELANDSLGYLPTPRHFEIGGYETWLGTNRVEPQTSVKMIDAWLEMFNDMKQRQGSEATQASK